MSKSLSGLKGNLVPTSRVDKNGRVVIRHMRAESIGTAVAGKLIPAPSPTRVPEIDALLNGAASLIEKTVEPDSSNSGILRDNLKKLSTHTLRRIAGATEPQHRSTIFSVYSETVRDEADESYINDLLELSDHFAANVIGNEPDGNLLIGARHSAGLASQGSDGRYPEERYRQLVGLIDVTAKIIEMAVKENTPINGTFDFSIGYLSPALADHNFREFILGATSAEHQMIVRIIGERKTANFDDIKALLESSDTVPLSNGAL